MEGPHSAKFYELDYDSKEKTVTLGKMVIGDELRMLCLSKHIIGFRYDKNENQLIITCHKLYISKYTLPEKDDLVCDVMYNSLDGILRLYSENILLRPDEFKTYGGKHLVYALELYTVKEKEEDILKEIRTQILLNMLQAAKENNILEFNKWHERLD